MKIRKRSADNSRWSEEYPSTELLRVVELKPGLTRWRLADELGWNRNTVKFKLEALEAAGKVRREVEVHGDNVTYRWYLCLK